MRKGSKHSDESRRKISLNNGMCPEVIEKIKAAKVGLTLNEDHKRKISLAMIGVKKTDEHRKNMGKAKAGKQYRLGMKNSKQHNEALLKSNRNRIVSEESRKKMSDKRKGTKLSQATIDKIRKPGKEHWNWKGGIAGKDYTTAWTKSLKHRIRERDRFSCQKCGTKQTFKKAFDVHHIDWDKKNCDEDNLITLCKSCHVKAHNIKVTRIL